MKFKFKKEEIQDLSQYTYPNIENQLTSILSDEIAKEIDKEIMRGFIQPYINIIEKYSNFLTEKEIQDLKNRYGMDIGLFESYVKTIIRNKKINKIWK